jgi:alpha-L-glutamate ligase-like protein
MRRFDFVLLLALTSIIIVMIAWVRINLPFFQPILEASTLFFQLILAGTVIAILRNIVGVRTFGVFGPTIVALGITGSGILWGIALYVDVFIMAMLASLALFPLAIASSHRIAIVIIITVMAITVLELVAELYRMEILQTSILFPVLITAWLADRFVVQVKEVDWIDPAKRLLGTVVVIIISYFIITSSPVVLFIALNPETWALMIIVNIALAVKVNFRLSEHFRFRPSISRNGGRSDVLGLNKRNRDFVARYNPPNLFPHMSKDKMKIAFHQLGIPAPRTMALIQNKKDITYAEMIMNKEPSFVIKPSNGLGGEGILVVDRTEDNGNVVFKAKGRDFSISDLKAHIIQILDGQFSSNWDDVAIIEEKIETDSSIKNFYWGGVPDFRVIVFEGFPVMAMTRLPTKESGGTANIHKGALSMGLTISEGKPVNPFWKGRGGAIKMHPDTGAVLTEMKIPNWQKVLETACMAQAASRLGYVGVDIVLDKKGCMVLEVNKRPGLEIQNTNLAGLLKRLDFVENRLHLHRFKPVPEKVKLSMKWDKEGWK